MPDDYTIHTPGPGRTRSARGAGQRGPQSATPLAPAPNAQSQRTNSPAPDARPEPTISDVLAALTTNHTTTLARLDAVAAVQEHQGRSIATLERNAEEVRTTVDETRKATEALAARVAVLEQAGSRPGSSAPSSRSSATSGGRPPPQDPIAVDRTIIRISTSTTIPLSEVLPAIKPLLERARVPMREVDVRGSQMAKNFVLRHKSGEAMRGEDMVEAIMGARRREDGTWLDVTIRTPHGSVLPLYIEQDRSHAQRKVGYHLSRAAKALRAAAPHAKFDIARSAGVVTNEWREVVTVKYAAETNSVVVDWKEDVLTSLALDHDTVRREFLASIRDERTGGGPQRG